MKQAHHKEAVKAKRKEKGKASNKSGPDKFKPPTTEEKNRRVIDGKAMWWASRIKKWIPDKGPPGHTSTAAVATPTVETPVPAPSAVAPPTTTAPNNTAAVAAARLAYANAFAALQQLS